MELLRQLWLLVVGFRRGDLEGLVIVGENVSVRRVRFNADGSVESLGTLALGGTAEAITGSVGVQP